MNNQNKSIIINNDGDNNLTNRFVNRSFRDQLNNSIENQSSTNQQQSNIDYQLNLSINKQNLTSTENHYSFAKEQINHSSIEQFNSNQLIDQTNLNDNQIDNSKFNSYQQNTVSTIKTIDDDLKNTLDNELMDSDSFIFKNDNQIILTNDYIFNLNWQTKDDLILMINRFTSILSGRLINKQTKDKIIKNNNELINQLINLKLKTNNSIKFKYSINEQYLNTNLLLDLKSDLRMQLISHLIKLQNLSINKDNTIQLADNLREELIFENNKLINELLNLNVNCLERDCDENNYLENEEIDKIKNKLVQLKNDQQLVNRDDLEYYETKFKEEIHCLNEKLREIKLIKRELDKRDTISFIFEINDATNFLNTINIQKNSKQFYCNNQPWFILIQIAETKINKEKIKYLEFYLVNCLNLKSSDKWTMDTSIELILFSNLTNKDLINKTQNIKFGSNKNTWGNKKFIKIDDLINPNNCYLFNGDKLKLGINLKCNDFIVKNSKFLNIF